MLPLQWGLLLAAIIGVWVFARFEAARWVRYARPALTTTIIFMCYTSLGKLGVAAMPYDADAVLSHGDGWLLGIDPSLAIQPWQTPGWVEFFSVAYGAFIPYIYLSLFLGCIGRPPIERDQFLTGWVYTYAISYLGYIFVPRMGRDGITRPIIRWR